MDTLKNHWKSDHPERLPDFIIGGAMKSGTSTLHAILNSHPEISIAKNELGFFDMDSILQHPDFNFFNPKTKTWLHQSMENEPELLWDWYYSQFEGIEKKGRLVGEDSTTYLCSEMAAKRIALQVKPIKIIFILRHPTQRAISNYLHLLKSGRAIYSLENTLRFNPNSILRRSMYLEQLEAYYKHLPFDRIKVVLFEDLIEDKQNCIKEVCEFLEIDYSKLNKAVFNTHSNKTKIPKHLTLQLFRNRLLRNMGGYRYSNFLPIQAGFQSKLPLGYKIIDRLHKKINPHKTEYKFSASKATVKLLDDFFKTELQGLDALVKKEICSKWFKTN
ncbi:MULTISPECIES: sulfotransferase family protein [Flavobacteriaceae]|uniref:sulfotransferase family protein n=1 Tax=Flavobacteriaceae TaxID=49546 RepID=UPI003A8D5DC8